MILLLLQNQTGCRPGHGGTTGARAGTEVSFFSHLRSLTSKLETEKKCFIDLNIHKDLECSDVNTCAEFPGLFYKDMTSVSVFNGTLKKLFQN